MRCRSVEVGQNQYAGATIQYLEHAARTLADRLNRGVGWTPTNIMITAHGPIAPGPWGAFGDLVLLPDLQTHVRVDFGDDSAAPEQFVLGDIRHLDGSPWECCLRDFLRRGLNALESEFGVEMDLDSWIHAEEIHPEVDPLPNAGYFRQAEYGMQMRMALISSCLGVIP